MSIRCGICNLHYEESFFGCEIRFNPACMCAEKHADVIGRNESLKSELATERGVGDQAKRIIYNCYNNFKCDHFIKGYMSYVGKDETPVGSGTGIAAKIHNQESLVRIKITIEEMKNFIEYLKERQS